MTFYGSVDINGVDPVVETAPKWAESRADACPSDVYIWHRAKNNSMMTTVPRCCVYVFNSERCLLSSDGDGNVAGDQSTSCHGPIVDVFPATTFVRLGPLRNDHDCGSSDEGSNAPFV
jgi:hypothetical protein